MLIESHQLIKFMKIDSCGETIRVDDFINRVMPEHKSSICDT